MTKFVTEMLTEVNDNPELLKTTYKGNNVLKFIFEHSFIKEKRFLLPDTDPPFKRDAAPIGMSPANFLQETKRFYVFCREDLSKLRRETLFIQLLDNVHPSEADVILAVKNQKLTKLYPKITAKVVADAGFIPAQQKKEKE